MIEDSIEKRRSIIMSNEAFVRRTRNTMNTLLRRKGSNHINWLEQTREVIIEPTWITSSVANKLMGEGLQTHSEWQSDFNYDSSGFLITSVKSYSGNSLYEGEWIQLQSSSYSESDEEHIGDGMKINVENIRVPYQVSLLASNNIDFDLPNNSAVIIRDNVSLGYINNRGYSILDMRPDNFNEYRYYRLIIHSITNTTKHINQNVMINSIEFFPFFDYSSFYNENYTYLNVKEAGYYWLAYINEIDKISGYNDTGNANSTYLSYYNGLTVKGEWIQFNYYDGSKYSDSANIIGANNNLQIESSGSHSKPLHVYLLGSNSDDMDLVSSTAVLLDDTVLSYDSFGIANPSLNTGGDIYNYYRLVINSHTIATWNALRIDSIEFL
tara:strand:+ start:5637 stop:6782 length:1146 start_codon:yes stop_codon:yes gene_type:complete